jgi:hypothetical protein
MHVALDGPADGPQAGDAGDYNRLHKKPPPNNSGTTVSMRSFMGGVLIGLTVDLPVLAGNDITTLWLQIGLLLWGALALGVIVLYFARPKEYVVRSRRSSSPRSDL